MSEPTPVVRDVPVDLDLLLPPDAATIMHVVDPCADGGEGCPAGVGGTILAGGIEPLQIMDATTDVAPGRFALYDECVRDHGAAGGDQAILAIISNHPATFTISGAWTGTAATSSRQVSRYEADRSRGNPHGVIACAVLRAGRGEIRIDGVDDRRSTAQIFRLIDARPLSRKRPPVSVNPTGELTLQVFVPIRLNEEAQVVAFRRDPFATTAFNCGYPLGRPPRDAASTSSQTIVPIPALVLEGSTEFDPAWSRVAVTNVRITGPSVPYDLCVRWLSREHSFDNPQLIEAETRVVNPPAHPDLRVSVDGLFALRDSTIDVSHLTVELKLDENVPRCGLPPGYPLVVADAKYETPVRMCEFHEGATGEWVDALVTYYGHRIEQPIHVLTHQCHIGSLPGCGNRPEQYTVNIPKPTGDSSSGFVELRFDYETPNGGTASVGTYSDTHWEVMGSIPAAVPGQDTPGLVLLQPQLDTFQTNVLPGPGELSRDTLVVRWTADRPVLAETFVDANDGNTCSRSPRPRAASTELATSGVLTLDGLCAGTRHDIGIRITDEAGLSSTYSNAEGTYADRIAPGFVATTERTPVQFEMTLSLGNVGALPPGTSVRLYYITALVNGELVFWNSFAPRHFPNGSITPDDLPCVDSPAAWQQTIGSTTLPTEYGFHGNWAEDVGVYFEVGMYLTQTPCGQPTNLNSFTTIPSYVRREIIVPAPLVHQHTISTLEGGPDQYEFYLGLFGGPNPVRLQFELPSLPTAG